MGFHTHPFRDWMTPGPAWGRPWQPMAGEHRALSLGMFMLSCPRPAWLTNTAPFPASCHALREEGAVGASPRNSRPGTGCRFLQCLISAALLLFTLFPPPQWAWGKRPLTLQPTAPESPHLWHAVMLRGHRTVNSKLSRLCHLLAGL